ncbi:MAG: hypothetical protein FJW31_08130 [Acidobacteria bacterium]|nr:hypothetical protein [Acidobacteriota bacterium]
MLIPLPVWGTPAWGLGLAIFGALLIAAVTGFARHTRPYIPRAEQAGAAIVAFGVAMYLRSALLLWIAAPVAVLLAITHARLHPAGWSPVLPVGDDASRPSLAERFRFWWIAALPWVAAYEFTAHHGLPGYAFMFAWEDSLPVYPLTSMVYQSTYVAVTAAPFLARTRGELRVLIYSAWASTALIFPFYWLAPSAAPRRPMPETHVLAKLLEFERKSNPPSAAFPSFHVLWSLFAGRLMRPAWVGVAYAVAVGVTCITTGMHYLPDALASLVIAPLFMWRPERLVVWGREWYALPFGAAAVLRVAMLGYGAPALGATACFAAILAWPRYWLPLTAAGAALLGLVL